VTACDELIIVGIPNRTACHNAIAKMIREKNGASPAAQEISFAEAAYLVEFRSVDTEQVNRHPAYDDGVAIDDRGWTRQSGGSDCARRRHSDRES